LLGALAVGLLLVGPARIGAGASQPRIAVLVSSDLDGGAATDGCVGCDGQIATGDALRGSSDPLPVLDVILRDGDGRELDRTRTTAQDFGAQSASLAVAAPGQFEVELVVVPGWQSCPGLPLRQSVAARDFSAGGQVARVEYSLWHGCPAEAPETVTVSSEAAAMQPPTLIVVPSAAEPRLPRTGMAVESTGHLMFGLAALAATLGLLGMAFESGIVRRS